MNRNRSLVRTAEDQLEGEINFGVNTERHVQTSPMEKLRKSTGAANPRQPPHFPGSKTKMAVGVNYKSPGGIDGQRNFGGPTGHGAARQQNPAADAS